MMAHPETTLIADLTLSWINDRLREELALRELQRVTEQVPGEFWRLQALRLLSFSLVGLGWLAIQIAAGA